MAKRKKRYRDTYHAVKSHQHVTRWGADVVHNWEIEEIFIDSRNHKVDKKRRSRIGFVQTRKNR